MLRPRIAPTRGEARLYQGAVLGGAPVYLVASASDRNVAVTCNNLTGPQARSLAGYRHFKDSRCVKGRRV